MSAYLPPLNNSDIFNVSDFNYQDSYISYYTGDKRYSKLNGMNTFTQLCYFNGGIYASSIFEGGINISLKYAPINNASLTGIPLCPLPTGTNTNQITNVNYVTNAISNIQFPVTNLSNYMDLSTTQNCSGSKTFSSAITTYDLIFSNNPYITAVATTIGIPGTTTGLSLLLSIYYNLISSKANIASPSFTTQITTPKIILNGTDLSTTLSTINTNINLKANIESPSFTTQITTPKIILNGTDLSTTLSTFITNFSIGTVTTLSSSSPATVTKTGTSPNFSFNFGIPQGVSPLFSIGTVSSIGYGGTATVTIDNTIITAPKLSFVLITGQKGDKGDPGTSVSAGDILSIITTALGGVSIAVLYGYVTTLQGQVITIQGQISAIDVNLASLNLATTGLTYSGTKSTFAQDLAIGITNNVVLSATGTSYFTRDIQTSQSLISTGITVKNNTTNSGVIKASIDNNGNISVANVTATGDIISIGTSVSSQTYLQGTYIQIGCSSVTSVPAPSIDIGKKNVSVVSLHGSVNIATDETNPLSSVNIGKIGSSAPINIDGRYINIATNEASSSQVTIGKSATPLPVTINASLLSINGGIQQFGTSNTASFLDTYVKSLTISNGNISQTIGSNTLKETTFNGNITQTYTTANTVNGETPFTTTLLDTKVKSLTLANGAITQTLGTTSLYNLTVANDVNLNGFNLNIGNNNEACAINIGNITSTTINEESQIINIGVATTNNIINIGNYTSILTMKSISNHPININNAMNQFQAQFDADANALLSEIFGF